MGNRRLGVVMLCSLVFAVLAGLGIFRLFQQIQTSAKVPTRRILVAAVDLPAGHVLRRQDLAASDIPNHLVPSGSFFTADSLTLRVTQVPIFAREPIIRGRLAPTGSEAGLEIKITPGKRAMAVRIDEVVGLSGLIQPNSRVDVLVTVQEVDANRQQRAKVFMTNMRVLSVGTLTERDPNNRDADSRAVTERTATLEVTPAEAEQLAVATNQGKIQLVLRGYADPDTVETMGATMSDPSFTGNRHAGIPVTALLGTPVPIGNRQPRKVQGRSQSPVSPPVDSAPGVPLPEPAPRITDSSVVQIYRGVGVTQQRIEKSSPEKP